MSNSDQKMLKELPTGKPKKHRRTKKQILEDKMNELQNLTNNKDLVKKRGRKPKGGKIVQYNNNTNDESKVNNASVILHLKCSLKELNYFNSDEIQSFNFNSNDIDYCESLSKKHSLNINNNTLINNTITHNDNHEDNNEHNLNNHKQCISNNEDKKNIWKKLKEIENCLHHNIEINNKSNCFWCTCSFDNPNVYIPKYQRDNITHVYGCFCSPECATASLMQENIGSSTKFERYQLLNNLYGKVYNYDKNIKPAPNPYYTLNKFCGNLTIQEYRSLFDNERLYLIIDKPLTRIFPELHEDNDDFIINNKIIPSNSVIMKKKKENKKDILKEHFSGASTSSMSK
jgi:hypothetical protein